MQLHEYAEDEQPAEVHATADFIAGIRHAADLIARHWNDSSTMTNQHQQALRSANALANEANRLEAAAGGGHWTAPNTFVSFAKGSSVNVIRS